MTGTLYLVATPIGNLEDITVRAIRILGEVHLIAAEDTRRTATLLQHYGIKTATTSLHDHNERRRAPTLVARLLAGDSIALLSDAGTPLVSDPGLQLVREAQGAGVPIVPLPGASAVLAALISSGAPANSFTFVGFPPRKLNERKNWCLALANEPRTLVLFESPHRLVTTLRLMEECWGDRMVALCRELTKIHEELVIQPISMIVKTLPSPRGEYTCVVWPPSGHGGEADTLPSAPQLLREFVQLTERIGSRRGAIKELAWKYRLPARVLYKHIEDAK